MNKQELIKAVIELPVDCSGSRPKIDHLTTLELIKLLDEPKPVKVPQIVADWYEDVVDEFYIVLERLVLNYQNNTNMPICKWFLETEDALKILVNMHQFGYEVKEENRYRISMQKARNYKNRAQFLCEKDGKMFWCGEWYPFKTKFTRKELEEANFGWVFDCPGIEIEEVE